MMFRYVKSHKKIILIFFAVLVFIVGSLGILEKNGKIDLISDKSSSEQQKTTDNKSKSTSDAESAQSNYTSGGSRQPETSANKGSATVSDKQGAGVQATTTATASADKVISVYTPTNNSILANGSSLTGKASVAKVSFRLIDNVSGVIATGTLSVVSGNFSGAFNFSTSATEGRVDVFQTRSDGVEMSVVEIPVRFR